ncbi:MAG: ectonucleotide pyrophosphatase/phosphodiesterase [Lachnospiraceae bacterium]
MSKDSKMIVLSWDAVGSRDLPFLKTLPNFGEFLERAAGCECVSSVYPSLTYPAHSSIVSGKYPDHHRVVNNFQLQPKRVPSDWFWQRKYIQGETFYEQAQKSGKKVAALLWPVTGKARISYNLPEVLPNRPWQNQILVSMLNGTVGYELYLNNKFGHLRDGVKQPNLDNFVHESALETLRKYQPDVMLVHLTDVDTHRHHFGVSGMEITKALERHDRRLGELTALLKKLGRFDDTNLIILGDHCQMDVSKVMYPNFELVNRGYVELKDDRVVSWRAIARECDGACYIYVKDPELLPEIRGVLEEMKTAGAWGIERIFTGAEAGALGADSQCAFMLEAAEGCYFQNDWKIPYAQAGSDDAPETMQAATHGYLPDKQDYQTIFFGAGPDFLPGARAEQMCLVDEGPTLAKILGTKLADTDGHILENLLRK